jgi:hypothetical protein
MCTEELTKNNMKKHRTENEKCMPNGKHQKEEE